MKSRKKMDKRSIAAYVFLFPGLAFFGFAVLLPFFMGANIAFTDWNGISSDYNYVWFDNFLHILEDAKIRAPFLNSFKFAVLGTISSNVFSLCLAMLLNQKLGKLTNIARVMFFIPVCFSAILTSFIWKFIYKEAFSALFGIKSLLGSTT